MKRLTLIPIRRTQLNLPAPSQLSPKEKRIRDAVEAVAAKREKIKFKGRWYWVVDEKDIRRGEKVKVVP